jgi:hypothetical protein
MPSAIDATVFSEPSGRPLAAVHFAGRIAFAIMYVHRWQSGDAPAVTRLLFAIAATAQSGTAESLPAGRRRTAGALRVAARLVLFAMLAVMVATPSAVIG